MRPGTGSLLFHRFPRSIPHSLHDSTLPEGPGTPEIPGIKVNPFGSVFFKEFVIDFTETGKTVEEINKALLAKGIFGGKDLSKEFPNLGQSALYCVTEVHMKEDLDTLAAAIAEVIK